jgi:O-antigen/teichoic acid export membrane protein
MAAIDQNDAPPAVMQTDHRVVRRKRIARVAVSGALARASAFLPTFGIAPIAVLAIGPERFGVLMTVLSLVALLGVADLGVGASVVTGIARAVGAGKHRRVRSLQANGLAVVLAMGLLLALVASGLEFTNIGAFAFPHSLPAVQAEATSALAAFALLFAASLPLTLVYRIQLGLQQGHVANNWQIAAGLLNFAAAALACKLGLGVPWIVFGLLFGTLSCGLINTLVQLRTASQTRPSLRDIHAKALRSLMSESTFYLGLQLIFLLTYTFDTLVVAHKLGARDASTYALAERLFSMIAVLVAIFTAPLWAAYGEALGRRDQEWARACLRTSVRRIALMSLLMSATLLALFAPAMALLGHKTLVVPLGVGFSMALWRVVESIGGALAAYLMAAQAVRLLMITGTITAIVSLTIKTLIVDRFGAVVLPLVTTVTFICCSLIPCFIYIRRSGFRNQPGAL